jgi:hypothetical protein
MTVAGIALLNLVIVGMVAVNGPVSPPGAYDAPQSGPAAPVQQSPSDQSDQPTQSPSSIPDEGVYPAPDPQPAEPDKSATEKPADSNAPADSAATAGSSPTTDGAPPPPDAGTPPESPDSDKSQDTPIVIPIPPSHEDTGGAGQPSDKAAGSEDTAQDGGAKPSASAPRATGTAPSDSGAGTTRETGTP